MSKLPLPPFIHAFNSTADDIKQVCEAAGVRHVIGPAVNGDEDMPAGAWVHTEDLPALRTFWLRQQEFVLADWCLEAFLVGRTFISSNSATRTAK